MYLIGVVFKGGNSTTNRNSNSNRKILGIWCQKDRSCFGMTHRVMLRYVISSRDASCYVMSCLLSWHLSSRRVVVISSPAMF